MNALIAATELGARLPLWSALPFVGLLLSIALVPLVAPHAWHRHYGKIALAWALLLGVPFVVAYGGTAVHAILHAIVADYVPFLVLVGGLYAISGGIVLRGSFRGTPLGNSALLLAGTALASLIGTTGAAMVLIRPLLRANRGRRRRTHVIVFFIILVANVGGCLTPLGDPPLFLGFLHGVPFTWTLHLAPHLLLCVALLLPVFFVIDTRAWRDEAVRVASPAPLRVDGLLNVALLGVTLGAVLMSGLWHPAPLHVAGLDLGPQNLLRDLVIAAAAAVSLARTPRALRRENEFSWGPIREVALVFAGIFVTIVPALELLRAGADGPLAPLVDALRGERSYFWLTGVLSSFLDNAPTYLAFFNTALGSYSPGMAERDAVNALIATHHGILSAISAGAVFMGCNTYIGNAPNFMVKAIAEEAGVPMPSFLGYIGRWTVPVLVPVFVILSLVMW